MNDPTPDDDDDLMAALASPLTDLAKAAGPFLRGDSDAEKAEHFRSLVNRVLDGVAALPGRS